MKAIKGGVLLTFFLLLVGGLTFEPQPPFVSSDSNFTQVRIWKNDGTPEEVEALAREFCGRYNRMNWPIPNLVNLPGETKLRKDYLCLPKDYP